MGQNEAMTTVSAIPIIIKDIRARCEAACQASALAQPSVTLLAASKSQPVEKILEAWGAGIRDFGENRVQEAEAKFIGLRNNHSMRLHLIGPLQSNKAREAVELFDVIHTVDRKSLADALATAMEKTGKRPECYIQVNTGKEPQKSGVIPEEASALIEYCISQLKLPITGLMCVPPVDQPPAPHFALLRKIAERHGFKQLSMGMSDDFETAIRMGSTCVRLGRSLFGERQA